ncbi:AAA family ATPase [Phaeodactylibacter xiamenensis]|uniref:AAA family ATPase n=1 Tax=Phaeodactylibacter xiamenensis TaxID=1524460 RepID=UPI003BA9697A
MSTVATNRYFFEDLKDMLKANYPLIYLATTEYNRTLQYVRRIAHTNQFAFNTWDCIAGLEIHEQDEQGKPKVKEHPDKIKDYKDVLQYIRRSTQQSGKELFFLEDFHKYFRETDVVVMLRKLAEQLKFYDKHILIVGPFVKFPPELEKFITVVNIPLPDRNDLEKRLNVILKKEALNDDLKKYLIDSALGMTDMEADLAFRLAKQKSGLNTPEAARIVANEKEQIIKKSGILDYFQVNQDLDKTVGGLENLKTWLKQRSKAFESKAQRFGLKEPKGILLLGVPGCGKSLTAKCIASLWKQPLLRLDVGKVFQAEVGASENNIRQAIYTAEAVAPCVLWIDEIEKGLNVGGGEKDGGTNSRVFSTILTWMQEKTKPVFVVATANDISQLPPEFLRKGRFDEIFFVDLPSFEERKHIFKIHLEKNNQSGIGDFDELAKKSKFFNGAEIEEAVKEAMFISYIENPDVSELKSSHVIKAIEPIVPLAQTMKNKIDGLREWASTRARPASAKPNTEKLKNDEIEVEVKPVKQTKREREEDIF